MREQRPEHPLAAAAKRGVEREVLVRRDVRDEAALEWAGEHGFTRIELYVYARNAPAIALYERHGFVHEGRRKHFIRDGEQFLDDLVMARVST